MLRQLFYSKISFIVLVPQIMSNRLSGRNVGPPKGRKIIRAKKADVAEAASPRAPSPVPDAKVEEEEQAPPTIEVRLVHTTAILLRPATNALHS